MISTIAGMLLKVLALLFIVGLLPAMWLIYRRSSRKVGAMVQRAQVDLAPLISQLTAIADNVNHITRTVRGEVDKVGETIDDGNARVREAIELTERRLQEFNALLEVVQEEAEDLFVSSASAVRAVRSGAAAFGMVRRRRDRRGGPEFAVDDLDGSRLDDAGDEEDTDDLEMEDDYDRATDASEERGRPAHPRIGPRTRRNG